jgi:NAD(P)-dependent dehydrogenase (short-subunit alcohol dehydrogenase family)
MPPVLHAPQVVVNYAASPDKAEEVAAEVKQLGGDAITVKANVGKREEIEALLKATTDKWGTIDVLVNNAGEACVGSVLGECWVCGLVGGGGSK